MNGQNVPVFDIGLAQAGAISAGAYTAGVIDFLIEALDIWEAHRGEPGVPHHRVRLKVISGASAGAIRRRSAPLPCIATPSQCTVASMLLHQSETASTMPGYAR